MNHLPKRAPCFGFLCAALLVSSLSTLPSPLFAARADSLSIWTAMDGWVEGRMREERIPGVALAVVRGGEVAYVRGYGIADTEGRRVGPQTPFPIGSVSKSFTGLAIAQLAEAGALDLDAPVRSYLPWFQVADERASDEITIRHLLTHTSGFSTLDGNRHRLRRSTADDALEQRARMLRGARLSAPPGTRFEYSNANYQVLGALIETVTGLSYEAYVAERIYAPLGMAAGFASMPDRTPPDMAMGHRYWFGHPRASPWSETDRHVVAQALVVASAEDMARYVLFNLGHAPDSGHDVLRRSGIDEMHDPGAFRYGFGWMVGERHGTRYVGHAGQNPGFFAFVLFSQERDEGVAVMINAADLVGRRGAEGIGMGVIDILAGVEPQVRPGSPIARIALVAAVAVLLLIASSMAMTRRRIGQWRRGERVPPGRGVARLLRIVPSTAFFGAVAYLLLVYVWQSFGATIGAGLQFAPDVAWLSLFAGGLAIAWALIRATLLFYLSAGHHRHGAETSL
jgi:CubicO group peptidase (beta-lactamase class C family)